MKKTLAFLMAAVMLMSMLTACGGTNTTPDAAADNDVTAEDADKALSVLHANGEDAYVIGEIVESAEKITIC